MSKQLVRVPTEHEAQKLALFIANVETAREALNRAAYQFQHAQGMLQAVVDLLEPAADVEYDELRRAFFREVKDDETHRTYGAMDGGEPHDADAVARISGAGLGRLHSQYDWSGVNGSVHGGRIGSDSHRDSGDVLNSGGPDRV